MKKLKLLFPLIGATSVMATLVPAVSCGSKERGDVNTYKVSLAESIKTRMEINLSSIDEGCDLFAIVKLNSDIEIIDGKPNITINSVALDQDKFTFTYINSEKTNRSTYRLKIPAEYINGDISIDVPLSNIKKVAKVEIANSLGYDASHPIMCSTPYFKEVPTGNVELEIYTTGDAKVYLQDLAVQDLNDESSMELLERVNSVADLKKPNQWAFTNPTITSGKKVGITVSVGTISNLDTRLLIGAFAVNPTQQAVVSEYTMLSHFNDESSSVETIEAPNDEDGTIKYDWDTKIIDYLWDGTVTFSIYDPDYAEYRFDGVSFIVCGGEYIDDYTFEISQSGDFMTIRFGIDALALIAMQSEYEGDDSALKIVPNLCYGSDLSLSPTSPEWSDSTYFSPDSTLLDPSHENFISQKQIQDTGDSGSTLIVRLTDQAKLSYTISSISVEFGGCERSDSEGVSIEIDDSTKRFATIKFIKGQTTWQELRANQNLPLAIWYTLEPTTPGQ